MRPFWGRALRFRRLARRDNCRNKSINLLFTIAFFWELLRAKVFPFARRFEYVYYAPMSFSLLAFNLQRGKRGLEFFRNLISENLDVDWWMFQRFPKGWAADIPKTHKFFYAPSFQGADNGCLVASSQPMSVVCDYTDSMIPVTQSQAFVFQRITCSLGVFVNTLPPFPEPGKVGSEKYDRHLQQVFGENAKMMVGDFHREDEGIDGSYLKSFKNYSQNSNFTGNSGQAMNLNKFYLSEKPKSFEEKTLHFSAEPSTHSPSIFRVEI